MHRKLVAVLLVMLLVASAVATLGDPGWIERRVLGVASDNSLLNRFHMADSALRMAHDAPAGVGIGSFADVYPFYRNVSVRSTLVESHTTYLTLLVELGLLGLGVFLWLLGVSTWRIGRTCLRSADPLAQSLSLGAMATSIALAAQAFTYSLEKDKFWWLVLGIGATVVAAEIRSLRDAHRQPDDGGDR